MQPVSKVKILLEKIMCFLGFHDWCCGYNLWIDRPTKWNERFCSRCGKMKTF